MVGGASYIWWVQLAETQYCCSYCGTIVEVVAFPATRPVDDPSHPWWQVPQRLGFDQAAAFWREQGHAGVYL